jgi:hypothetical protein
LESPVELLIQGVEEELRPFVLAVIQHLYLAGGSGDRRELIAARVIGMVEVEQPAEDAATALLLDPEVLASFFQNADLLPVRGTASERVARIVTLALESAWES